MHDYTPEGVRLRQGDIAVSQLYLIDKKLKKINRNLGILTLLGVTLTIVKYRDQIKKLKNMKGE